MANILLTNICNQKCPYCFAAGVLKRKNNVRGSTSHKEMSFGGLKKVLDFLETSGEKIARFMGGEPTLHSEFEKFINYTLSRNFNVHIFTNGLFSSKIGDFLAEKGQEIKYSFNINPPDTYSKKHWETITANLQKITAFRNSVLGVVIWQKDFNLNYVLDLVGNCFFKDLVLRLANPIIGKENIFIPKDRYSVLVSNLVKEIKKFEGRKIPIDFGCGLSKKMFSKEQLQVLKERRVVGRGWGCDGNTGRFDIGIDLSVFRCFPLSNWKKKKLADFRNVKEVEEYFGQLMEKYQSGNSDIDFIHQGPCFSYLVSKKKYE